jgi:hypothetical protein
MAGRLPKGAVFVGLVGIAAVICAWSPWVTPEFSKSQIQKTLGNPTLDACTYGDTVRFTKVLFGAEVEASLKCFSPYEHSTKDLVLFTGDVISKDDDWSHYSNQKLRLSFEYPSHWKLTESNLDHGDFSMRIEGDGYSFEFSNVGKGYPGGAATVSYKYTVDGRSVTVLEDREGSGFMQGIPICPGVGLIVSSDHSSKEISDKVIESVECL